MYKKDEELTMEMILQILLYLKHNAPIDKDNVVSCYEDIGVFLHELSPECQMKIIEFGRNYAKKYSGEKKDSLENIAEGAGLTP